MSLRQAKTLRAVITEIHIQFSLSTTTTLGMVESGCSREAAVMGR